MSDDHMAEPVVFTKNGKVFANSRYVATFFDKQHGHVLRDIDNLLGSPNLESLSGAGSSKLEDLFIERNDYHDQARRHVRTFDLTRDGFSLLAMGFTGSKALAFKLRYIDAFNRMEAELRSRPFAVPDLSDPVVLVQLLTEHASKRIEAERRAAAAEEAVEASKPKTAFYDQFVNADGSYGLQNAARVLGQMPNKFIAMLKREYLFYQGGDLVPYAKFKKKEIFDVKATLVGEKVRQRTYITPRGMKHFADVLRGTPDLFHGDRA